jgi:hypothetical protein
VQLKRSFADNPAGKIVVVHDGHAPSALLVAWDALSAELGLEVRELDRRHEVSAPQRLEQKAAAARGAVFVFLDDSDVYAPRRALGDAVRESSIGALVQSAHALPLHLGAQHGARDEEPPSSIVADARITDVDALRTDTMRFALCKALPFPLKVERFEALLGDDTPMRDALLRAVVSDLAEEQRVAREHVDTTLPRLQQLTEAFGGVRFEEARSEVLLSLVSDVRALTRLGERTRDRVLFHRPLHEVTRQTDAMLEGLLTRVCGEPKTKSGADARRLVNFGAKRRAEQWKAVIDAKSDRMKLEPAIVPSMPRIEAMTTDFAVRLDNEARAAAPSSSKDAAPKSSRR